MWKDVPRSALWFGAGSFSILSASFMKEMQLGYGFFSMCFYGYECATCDFQQLINFWQSVHDWIELVSYNVSSVQFWTGCLWGNKFSHM